jgi:hypothetical protein
LYLLTTHLTTLQHGLPESDFFSDLEAAADNVVNEASSGALSFFKASGDNVAMEVEALPVAHEGTSSHTTLRSLC